MKDAHGHGSDGRGGALGIAAQHGIPTGHLVGGDVGIGDPEVRAMLRRLGPVTEPPEVTFSRMERQAQSGAVRRVQSKQTGEAFK